MRVIAAAPASCHGADVDRPFAVGSHRLRHRIGHHIIERIDDDLRQRAIQRRLRLLRVQKQLAVPMRSVRSFTASPARNRGCRTNSTSTFRWAGVPLRKRPLFG
jgi:hypothetical protein